eukprot:4195261-Pyramimonas_sp.AAC.1
MPQRVVGSFEVLIGWAYTCNVQSPPSLAQSNTSGYYMDLLRPYDFDKSGSWPSRPIATRAKSFGRPCSA